LCGPFLHILSQAAIENLVNLFWAGHHVSRLSETDGFEGRIADRFFQSHVYEIQVKQILERINYGINNLRCVGTRPTGRKSQDPDQVIVTVSKAPDFVGRIFGRPWHVRGPSKVAQATLPAVPVFHGGTLSVAQRTDLTEERR
jgi:hypothetical protein